MHPATAVREKREHEDPMGSSSWGQHACLARCSLWNPSDKISREMEGSANSSNRTLYPQSPSSATYVETRGKVKTYS